MDIITGSIVLSHILNIFLFFRDNKETKTTIDEFFGVGVHEEDILCSTLLSPNIIASGSYKGEIFLWNLDSHKLLKKMYSSVGDQMIEREGKLYICILSLIIYF